MTPSTSDDSSDGVIDIDFLRATYPTLPPCTPPKPRRRPPPILGIDPGDIVGKVLTNVRKSPNHPTLTLDFSDHTTFQILVDGYNPHPDFQGVAKILEMDSASESIFDPPDGHLITYMTITDCAAINLSDRAFDSSQEWEQMHQGIAFKFGGDNSWHCVWATLAEHDKYGTCIFRSYSDVYLENLQRSPRRRRPRRQSHSCDTGN
jgi:hypothetical protein